MLVLFKYSNFKDYNLALILLCSGHDMAQLCQGQGQSNAAAATLAVIKWYKHLCMNDLATVDRG